MAGSLNPDKIRESTRQIVPHVPEPLRASQHGKHEEQPTVKLRVPAARHRYRRIPVRSCETRATHGLRFLIYPANGGILRLCVPSVPLSHSQLPQLKRRIFFHGEAKSLGHWDTRSRTLSHSCSYNL